MVFRELITKWGFDVEHDKLDKIENQLEKIRGRLEFLAAAEVVKGIIELTEKFAHWGESLHVAAESAGITVEALQQLSFAASKSSISQEEMSMSLARLSRHLYEARRGSEQSLKAFAEVGFSGAQVAGFRTSADAMRALADRFKGIEDPIKKQALAMQLLGRGSLNMVGFLSQGSDAIGAMGEEASKFGAVVGHQNVEALAKMEHSLTTLWGVVKAVGATIASYFAPSVQTAVDEILNFWAANKKLIDTNVRAWVWDVTYAMGAVWAAVKFVAQGFFDFANAHPLLVRRLSELLVGLGALVGALFVTQKAVGGIKSAFDTLKWAVQSVATVIGWLATPIGAFIAAAALMVVGVHDLWEAVHGRPTWIGHLINFLGIGKQVEAVFFAIFDIMEDIMNLDFSKLLTDAVNDVKELAGFASKMGGKALSLIGLGGEEPGAVSKGVQNLNAVGALANNNVGAIGAEVAPVQSLTSGANMTNSINAPITINVPAGTSPEMVGQKVKEGVREHLDKLHRETARSLTPAQQY